MDCRLADSRDCSYPKQILAQLRNATGYQTVAQIKRRLLAWSDNDDYADWLYVIICLLLTCMAGLMSGLTLGLLSLDTVDLEVLLRSGTAIEQRRARKIMPIIAKNHLLLVTLLFCNALAMEALPLFLDKLADPVTAVIVSVTAVLFFGEIIPQSVCSRYGLAIGARLAPLVRLLMWLCTPVAWPMGKLLDLLIGPDHHTLFRRRQLKELVSMHAEDAGMGGALTRDEIKVITGALDLTSKVAFRAMTPLEKVFMLSSSDRLDENTLRSILRSGHSRIPVHREGDRGDVVGLVLVKELLQYRLGSTEDVPVSMLRIRSIPRLPATTRMYDMLRLFQTGRSHMAVLTQPPPGELQRLVALEPSLGSKRGELSRSRSVKGPHEFGKSDGSPVAPSRQESTALAGNSGGDAGTAGDGMEAEMKHVAAARAALDDDRSVAGEAEGDAEAYLPYSLYYATSGGVDTSYPPSVLDPQGSFGTAAPVATLEVPASFQHWSIERPETPGAEYDAADTCTGEFHTAGTTVDLSPPLPQQISSVFAAKPAFAIAAEAAATEATGTGTSISGATATSSQLQLNSRRLSRLGLEAAGAAGSAAGSAAMEAGAGCGGNADMTPNGRSAWDAGLPSVDGSETAGGSGDFENATAGIGPSDNDPQRTAGTADANVGYHIGGPEHGRPIGIITIEDVIEELIRAEIVDETDRYIDNNRLIRANQAQLAQSLPEHLAKVLAAAGASKKAAALHRGISGNLIASQGIMPSRRSFTAGLGLSSGSPSWGGAGSARDMSRGSSGHYQPQSTTLWVPLLQGEQP